MSREVDRQIVKSLRDFFDVGFDATDPIRVLDLLRFEERLDLSQIRSKSVDLREKPDDSTDGIRTTETIFRTSSTFTVSLR